MTEDIANCVGGSIKKYIKYYNLVDASDLYYTALVLDPRVKGNILLNELDEENAGGTILRNLRDDLHLRCSGTSNPLVSYGRAMQAQS